MKNRRGFLTRLSVASGTALLTFVASAKRKTAHAAPTPTPVAPTSSSASVAASPAALALAATFRAFDPHLTDAELQRIAERIDADRTAYAALNPKGAVLRNGDEMVVRFAAGEHV